MFEKTHMLKDFTYKLIVCFLILANKILHYLNHTFFLKHEQRSKQGVNKNEWEEEGEGEEERGKVGPTWVFC